MNNILVVSKFSQNSKKTNKPYFAIKIIIINQNKFSGDLITKFLNKEDYDRIKEKFVYKMSFDIQGKITYFNGPVAEVKFLSVENQNNGSDKIDIQAQTFNFKEQDQPVV